MGKRQRIGLFFYMATWTAILYVDFKPQSFLGEVLLAVILSVTSWMFIADEKREE